MENKKTTMISKFLLKLPILLCVLISIGCGGSDSNINSKVLSDKLQIIAEDTRTTYPMTHSVVLSLRSNNGNGFAASGTISPDSTKTPNENSGIRIASVSKLFTATSIMLLAEQGKLSLDDSIATYLPASSIKGLSLINGKDYTATITIRQLLSHRSGLADYATDGEQSSTGFTKFGQVQVDDPDRLWSLQDTIDWTRDNLKTFSRPGQSFHYADTNFQLAGLIIESITKKPLYAAVRELIFDPLGMNETFDEFRETELKKKNELIHYFLGTTDVTSVRALSADYAGGGWTSSTKDLNRFLQALTTGEILNKSSYEAMTTKLSDVTTFSAGSYGNVRTGYGLGVVIWKVDGLGTFIGHDGFFNTYAFYWVDEDAYLVGSLNITPDSADYTSSFLNSADELRKFK